MRTEGRALSVASRMDSNLLRGRTRWSYSIMHERTPGLVSTIPGTACSNKTRILHSELFAKLL